MNKAFENFAGILPCRYAFAHPRTNKAPQLYDLLADPHENKNLAASNPAIVKELTALMQKSWDSK